jgi:hypothetical protein
MFGPTHSSLPIGTIIAFAGQLAQPGSSAGAADHVTSNIEAWGWMLCDGRSLPSGPFVELYSCLGILYGGTVDTFNIPDLRGYFLRGADPDAKVDLDATARKAVGGTASPGVGSLQGDAMQNHVHLEAVGGTPAPVGPVMAPFGVGPIGPAIASVTPSGVQLSMHETRPKNVAVHYLIRFTNRLQLG